MRTYDPFVNSPEISRLFSGSTCGCRSTQTVRNPCSGAQNRGPVQSASAVCFIAYFCCCNRKCGAMYCSCRQGCAWACKGSSPVCVRSVREIEFLLQYWRLVIGGRGKHLANGCVQDRCSSARRNRFLLRLLFRVELCGSNWNNVGVLEHARS
jgi:hypothetical protein